MALVAVGEPRDRENGRAPGDLGARVGRQIDARRDHRHGLARDPEGHEQARRVGADRDSRVRLAGGEGRQARAPSDLPRVEVLNRSRADRAPDQSGGRTRHDVAAQHQLGSEAKRLDQRDRVQADDPPAGGASEGTHAPRAHAAGRVEEGRAIAVGGQHTRVKALHAGRDPAHQQLHASDHRRIVGRQQQQARPRALGVGRARAAPPRPVRAPGTLGHGSNIDHRTCEDGAERSSATAPLDALEAHLRTSSGGRRRQARRGRSRCWRPRGREREITASLRTPPQESGRQ